MKLTLVMLIEVDCDSIMDSEAICNSLQDAVPPQKQGRQLVELVAEDHCARTIALLLIERSLKGFLTERVLGGRTRPITP
jgi:hypothetical protein